MNTQETSTVITSSTNIVGNVGAERRYDGSMVKINMGEFRSASPPSLQRRRASWPCADRPLRENTTEEAESIWCVFCPGEEVGGLTASAPESFETLHPCSQKKIF